MKPWKRIDPTIVNKIDYHNIVVKTFELPDGKLATRATFLAEGRRATGVIAITKDKQVIVCRQFRPGPEEIMGEIPGGYVDEDEDPQAAAIRELREETGYEPGGVEFLGKFSRDAYLNGEWFYYLATDCMLVDDQSLDHDEFINLELRSIDEFIVAAKAGRMTDPAAVLAAYDRLKQIQKEEK
ncbi:MAG TPA: NUDIX hydrolase [Candidatus Chromulinivoraceae bacterium]|nr:NUDIX hydrolase [Candidatus Chromulinivoraceae bacterium]